MADDLVLNVLLRAKDSASSVITGMGANLEFLQNLAARTAGALAAIGVASVKMAGDFQAGLTTLVTSAGESKQNLQMVGDGIKQMSVDTATSTQQLISGMYMVESAGYHGRQGLLVLSAAARGARAENAPLADVANSVTSALNAYHLSADSATWVTNDLVAAVGAGKMHMSDLAASLSNVLPVSSAFHISLQDTTAAISTMTMQGDDAASAATHLRQMILALEAPSSAGAKALKSIGLSSQQVSDEMKRSLPGALQMITDHLKHKFPEGSAAYNAALKNIAGGSKQMLGMLELSGTHLQAFKNNVAQVSNAVKQGGNSIAGWSDVTQTFNFKLAQAKESLSVLFITIGQALLPVATQLIGVILAIVTGISRLVQIGGNFISFLQHGGVLADIVKIALMALGGAVLGFAASAIPALVTGFIAWATTAGAAALATLAAAAPFILVGAIIGAVVGGIILVIKNWGKITEWLKEQWHRFQQWFANLWHGIQTFLRTALAVIVGIILGPFTIIGGLFVWLYNHNTYFKKLVDAIVGHIKPVLEWLRNVWNNVIGWLVGKWNGLVNSAKSLWNKVTGVFRGAWGAISGALGDLWNKIKGWFDNLISNAFNWGKNLLNGFINGAKSMLGGIGNFFHNVASSIGNFLGFHSPTKEGPGREADKWSPNLMKMYMQGIRDNIPALKQTILAATNELAALDGSKLHHMARRSTHKAVASAAQFNAVDVSNAISSAGSLNSGVGASGSGVTVINNITINAPHTSAQDVVKLVMKELTFQNKRRGNFVTTTSGGRV